MNDIHSLASAYVVGALTHAETEEFEAHLVTCEACQAEVAELREVAADLSVTSAATPPTALRTSVLAAIATTPQDPATSPTVIPLSRATEGQARPDDHASGTPDTGSSRWTTRASALIAAAAVLAAIGFGGWALHNRQTAEDATAQTEQLTQLLGASDVRTASADFAGGGAGTVLLSRSEGKAVLVGSELPDLPEGKVYEAWTIAGPKPVPAGTFGPDDDVHTLPGDAIGADTIAVTVEPTGGSDQPTTDPIFAVEVPR